MPDAPKLRVVKAERDDRKEALGRLSPKVREELLEIASDHQIADGDPFWGILLCLGKMIAGCFKHLEDVVLAAVSPRSKDNQALREELLRTMATAANLQQGFKDAIKAAEGLPGAMRPDLTQLRAEVRDDLKALLQRMDALEARLNVAPAPLPSATERLVLAALREFVRAVLVVGLLAILRRWCGGF